MMGNIIKKIFDLSFFFLHKARQFTSKNICYPEFVTGQQMLGTE